MSWDEGLGSLLDLADAHDHVDAYWFPHTDRMQVKTNDRVEDRADAAAPLAALLDDDLLSNRSFGAAQPAAAARCPASVPRHQPGLRAGADRAHATADVAHRVFTTPRQVVFKEMEYAVPREAGLAALREARRAIDASDWRISFPVEIRFAPADDIPLSTATGRDSVYLAFHTLRRGPTTRPYFREVERIMRAHDGRPHWGKVHTRTAADLAPSYPRFGDFLAMRDRLDPDRVFANAYLRRVLGD